jgi:tRNA G37 N-methylase Trm5
MTSDIPGFFRGTEMPTAGWWEALWPDPAGVLAAVGIEPGMEVVDLCSGDGWFTLQIAKIARHVIAIDIDPSLLEVARHRLAESGATNCDFVAGDAYELAKLVSGPPTSYSWRMPFTAFPIGRAWRVPRARRSARPVVLRSSTGISARARKR